jgi:hypothetical protein
MRRRGPAEGFASVAHGNAKVARASLSPPTWRGDIEPPGPARSSRESFGRLEGRENVIDANDVLRPGMVNVMSDKACALR